MHSREALALFITIIAIAGIAVVLQGNPGVSGLVARSSVNTVAQLNESIHFLLLSNGSVLGAIEIVDGACYLWPPNGIGPPSKIGRSSGVGDSYNCYQKDQYGSYYGYAINLIDGKWEFKTINLSPSYSGTAIPY